MDKRAKSAPTLYTAKDIQRIFQCSDKKAYALMHSPGFPSFSIDKRLYVEANALNKWLERQRGYDSTEN